MEVIRIHLCLLFLTSFHINHSFLPLSFFHSPLFSSFLYYFLIFASSLVYSISFPFFPFPSTISWVNQNDYLEYFWKFMWDYVFKEISSFSIAGWWSFVPSLTSSRFAYCSPFHSISFCTLISSSILFSLLFSFCFYSGAFSSHLYLLFFFSKNSYVEK